MGELAEPFEISPSGFSKHLRVMERAGLLRQHKRGRSRYCEVIVEPIDEAAVWINRYRDAWKASLGSFAQYAEKLKARRDRKPKK